MAKFGSPKAAGQFDPSQLNGADKLSIFGAMLKDAVGSYNGEDSNNVLNIQSLLGARQQDAQKQKFLQDLSGQLGPQYDSGPSPTISAPRGMIGGSAPPMSDPMSAVHQATQGMAPGPTPEGPAPYQYRPPQRTADSGLNIMSPGLPGIMLGAPDGLKDRLGMMLDAMKAQKLDLKQATDGSFYNPANGGLEGTRTANRVNANGTITDLNDPNNTNRVISEAPVKGAMPVYDNMGRVTDWSLPVGARQAIGQASEADKRGATMGTMFTRPNEDGSSSPALGSQMFGPGAGGGVAGGPGRTQTPSAAAAAKIEAESAANARVDLPRLKQTSDQATTLIDQMLKHPSLNARTGMTGLLPAFAGTKDAGFDAMDRQIHGKTFLEAFQSLKGAGQITEVEGAKATDAIARLSRSQSSEDYKAALKDLRGVISTGMERAKTMAGTRPAAQRGPVMAGKGFKILSVE